MNDIILDWPPPYKIKKSLRSKRISLRISLHSGLEIIIPNKGSERKAIEFLDSKYEWVQKHRHLLQAKNNISLPNTLDLKLINEVWNIEYVQLLNNKSFWISEQQKKILIQNNASEKMLSIIKKWLRKKAYTHLKIILQQCSENYRLNYNELKVRYQNSRWGSCSKDKNINLNCKLLLLPFDLTHYVIVHELVHTIHFDHSPKFWTKVEEIVPDHLKLRAKLKNIEHLLPNWLY